MPKVSKYIALLLAAVVIAAGAWFASRAFYISQDDRESRKASYTVKVTAGEVGDSLDTIAEINWRSSARIMAPQAGVITSVDLPADGYLKSGDKPFTINLSPVVVFVGSIPAFRDMQIGISGKDVTQIQTALGIDPTGNYDKKTENAVKRWQKEDGLPVTGTVKLGEVAFLPALPATASLSENLRIGATISPGESVIEVFEESPEMIIRMSAKNEDVLKEGLKVNYGVSGKKYSAQLGATSRDPNTGDVIYRLSPLSGENSNADANLTSLCPQECVSQLRSNKQSTLPVDVEILPSKSGITLPVAAIRSNSFGKNTITIKDGQEKEVKVLQEAHGLALVTGVTEGEEVKLFGDAHDKRQ